MNTIRTVLGTLVAVGGLSVFAAMALGAWLLEPGCDVRRKGEQVSLTPLPPSPKRYLFLLLIPLTFIAYRIFK